MLMLKNVPSRTQLIVTALIAISTLVAFAAQQAPAPTAPVDPMVFEQRLGLTGPVNPKLPSIILVGDSTVRNGYGSGPDGLWGWGAPLSGFFDLSKINVVNRAIGGLSSHTYISDTHWDATLAYVKPGDFVLIQFGHNDGGLTLPGAAPIPDDGIAPGATPPPHVSGTPSGPRFRGSLPGIGEETIEVENPRTHQKESVHTFGWYLRKYVADARAKGATPILCSLVPRKFWVEGHTVRQTNTYRGWTHQVAVQENVAFLDLNEIIARRYDALGPATVETLFGDPHTHTNLSGAELNAECVVAGLRALPGDPFVNYLSTRGKAVVPYVSYVSNF
jgi:lysophospholipase L1-like esterase